MGFLEVTNLERVTWYQDEESDIGISVCYGDDPCVAQIDISDALEVTEPETLLDIAEFFAVAALNWSEYIEVANLDDTIEEAIDEVFKGSEAETDTASDTDDSDSDSDKDDSAPLVSLRISLKDLIDY